MLNIIKEESKGKKRGLLRKGKKDKEESGNKGGGKKEKEKEKEKKGLKSPKRKAVKQDFVLYMDASSAAEMELWLSALLDAKVH